MEEEFMMGVVGPDDDDEFKSDKERVKPVLIPVPRKDVDAVREEMEFSASLPNRKVLNFMELYEEEVKLEFLIPDVLPRGGLVFLGGLSGTGKTILATQVVVDLVLGRPTMTWKPTEGLPQLKAVVFSLEMSRIEIHRRIHDMYPEVSEKQAGILRENLFVYAEPEPFELWNFTHIGELARIIIRSGADVVLIDSASVSFAESLKDDVQVNQSLKNLYALRSRIGVSIVVVAHTRKPSMGISSSPEDASINELFGHSGIAQHASTIFLMLEDESSRKKAIKERNGDKVDKVVHVVNVKTRFGSSNAAFKAKLTSREDTLAGKPLQFRRDAIELAPAPVTEEQRRKIRSKKSPLSESLKGIDFGSVMGEDDDI